MKSFKEYLVESKKIYAFKIKIAGDCPKDCAAQIKEALAEFDVSSVSGKSTPITAQVSGFPDHKNISVQIFDVVTDYPATSKQVRDRIAEVLKIKHSDLNVQNEKEQEEERINHQHDEPTGVAVVGTTQEPSDHQDIVGEKQKLNFLKELSKTKHDLKQYTGVNDELFPKAKATKEQAEQSTATQKSGMTSPVGTKKVKLTPYAASVHNSLNVADKGKGK
jgi:hypothetical protein